MDRVSVGYIQSHLFSGVSGSVWLYLNLLLYSFKPSTISYTAYLLGCACYSHTTWLFIGGWTIVWLNQYYNYIVLLQSHSKHLRVFACELSMSQSKCGEWVQQLLHETVIGLHGGRVCNDLKTTLTFFTLPIALAVCRQKTVMTLQLISPCAIVTIYSSYFGESYSSFFAQHVSFFFITPPPTHCQYSTKLHKNLAFSYLSYSL